jgi:hypothetical protein
VAKSRRCSRGAFCSLPFAQYRRGHARSLLHLEDFPNVSGVLLKDGTETLFGIAGVFQASDQIGVLVGTSSPDCDSFFNTAKGLESLTVAQSSGAAIRETPCRPLSSTHSELRRISVMPSENQAKPD